MVKIFSYILGVLFLSAGVLKLTSGQQAPDAIAAFLSALPAPAGALVPILPWLEIAVGLALFLGPMRQPAAGAALALVLVLAFITANIQALLAGTQSDCGCFGNAIPLGHWQSLTLNIIMLGMVLACLLKRQPGNIPLTGEKKRRVMSIARAAISVMAVLIVLAASFSPMPLPKPSWLAAADPQGQFQLAPLNPQFEEWQKSRSADRLQAGPQYGDIPLPMDLNHLKQIPVTTSSASVRREALPNTFDWRTQSKVTPVKDQNPCGTCWTFAALASLESRIAIVDGTTYDFSEQNLACCTDPAYYFLVGNRCNGGGNIIMSTETLIKKGARLESCNPYNTSTINSQACNDTCTTVVNVTDLRIVASSASQTTEIKNALYTYGPLRVSYRHDNSKLYTGNIYYWPNCTQSTNHAVTIVGWDDAVAHPAGGGTGAWIVKNSWGTAWANSGYFYLCYGSANLSSVGSYHGSNGYITPGASDKLYYWDEAGWVNSLGFGGATPTSGWMASVFTADSACGLSRVEFWTTSNNAQYQAYVYNGSFGAQLTSQSGTCAEAGYYSIPLTTAINFTAGQQFTIAVKMTTPGYNYPIPVEHYWEGYCNPTLQTGVSFVRAGNSGAWTDGSGYAGGLNVCLRARVGVPIVAPTVETSAASAVTSNSATLNGNLTSLGSATSVNVYFEYGTTTSYGTPTPPQAKTATGTFSQDVTGLANGTGYHARAKADGGIAGIANGTDISFTTATPPAVATVTATDVTATSATLNGNLTSLGSSTTVNVSFEYGQTTNYGSTTTPQARTATGPFSAGLTGLATGPAYHYRAKAEAGAAGTVYGSDMAFPMSWQWQNPLTQGYGLQAVWGSSSSNVFAVGQHGTIVHYNGTAWSAMTSGTIADLTGVWGSSASDVFAVGSGGTILHYDGTAWSAMTSGTTQNLNGIWGSSSTNVFAVGNGGVILRYNGTSWTTMTSGAIWYDFNSVWGSSASDVFAVGYSGKIYHYDGSVWSAMTSGTESFLYGVWGNSASDVFAVGGAGTILHYNGNTWSVMTSGTGLIYLGVWGSSGSNVYAAGWNANIYRYDGSAWNYAFGGKSYHLNGIWGTSASDIFAVGDGGMIVHYNGTAWSDMATGTANWLKGVWGCSATDVFAVGDSGAILHYNGTAWSAMTGYSYGWTPYGIWGASASNIFATVPSGGAAVILRYNGSSWSYINTGTFGNYYGIWGSSASDIYIAGDSGSILRYNGSAFSAVASSTGNNLYGIWGSSASDIFAVGANGTIIRYNGSSWNAMTSGTNNLLYGVWGSSASDVFAVGAGGTILHYNGTAWSAMTSGVTSILWGVWGSSGSDVFAVGDGGIILHYNGSAWATMSGGSPSNNLMGIWGSSASDVFAVGRWGTILHYAPLALAVTTGSASDIRDITATLNGNLASLGLATTVNVSFEYGTTTAYGITTPSQARTVTGPFSAAITSLSVSTLYHNRARVDGGTAGIAYGDDTSFTTLAAIVAPAVTTLAATNVAVNTATLNGNLTSLGSATSVNVSFGYGISWPLIPTYTALETKTATGAFSANLTGLAGPKRYYFFAKADGGVSGIGYGTTLSFDTYAAGQMVAETALIQGIDAGDIAVVSVKINRIKDPATGNTATIAGGIGAYSATASSAQATGMIGGFSGMEFTGVGEVTPYLNPTFNATTGVFGVSNVASPEQPNNSTVVKLLMKLNGDKDTAYTFTVAFQSITAATGGGNVPEDSAKTVTFRRGDTNGNGTVDVFDAMFIAQYVVGVRPASQINAVNAACVKHDTGNDKLDIFDAMYIAQMVVGVRNNRFE
ncbi:MAG: C1 family peptidase [Chloroflexota bacterium]